MKAKSHTGNAPEGTKAMTGMAKVVEEYNASMDAGLVSFAQRVRNKEFKQPNLHNYYMGKVSARAVSDIRGLTGVNVTGYNHNVNGGAIGHIEYRHGPKGKADKSMADINNYGKLKYVLGNYDEIILLRDGDGEVVRSKGYYDSDGGHAPVVLFKKRVNGTFYVSEAVPDTKTKLLQTTSAYKVKTNNGGEQLLNMVTKTPQLTSETLSAMPPIDTNITNSTPKVNSEVKNNP